MTRRPALLVQLVEGSSCFLESQDLRLAGAALCPFGDWVDSIGDHLAPFRRHRPGIGEGDVCGATQDEITPPAGKHLPQHPALRPVRPNEQVQSAAIRVSVRIRDCRDSARVRLAVTLRLSRFATNSDPQLDPHSDCNCLRAGDAN